MARVLLSAFSNVTWTKKIYHDTFTEGFINALERCGNNVLSFHLNSITYNSSDMTIKDDIDIDYIRENVKTFDPELIITFNNCLPGSSILEDTNCPICVYSADVPTLYVNPDDILHNKERYYFLNGSHIIAKAVEKLYTPLSGHSLFFGHATDMRTLNIPQTQNIMYIGSMPNHSHNFTTFFLNLDANETDVKKKNEIKQAFFRNFEDVLESEFSKPYIYDFSPYLDFDNQILATNEALCLCSCKNKLAILSQITDLGLEIHGFPYSWPFVMQYNYELFKCFNYELSVTLEQNQHNFNKSKLSLNMPNATQKEGLSWRVTDIMATNSCLLTQRSKTLDEFFSPYKVTFPTYESPLEARALALKLLRDEPLRKELVQIQNSVIRDKCRFEHKFGPIEEMTGVPLLNTEVHGSSHIFIPHLNPTEKPVKMSSPQKLSLRNKIRYKIWHHFNKILEEKGII